MAKSATRFASEADLVTGFSRCLGTQRTPWGPLRITREWDYRNGVTDVLAKSGRGEIIAFEAKLRDWKRASHQAYRNTVFATRSYVVLPAAHAAAAMKDATVFSSYGVGLCTFDGRRIEIMLESRSSKPLVPWLRARAEEFFDRGGGNGGSGRRRRGTSLRAAGI